MADTEEPEKTVSDESVVSKYAAAAKIANNVLKKVIQKCVEGASCREISCRGDELIVKSCSKFFKKEKELKRGIAFPTCVSTNNCICHFSPLPTEPDYVLKNNDVVKIDLGAHVDGFIAVVAHTIVVGAAPDKKITGRKADAFLAAYRASQAALKLLKPYVDTYAITDAVQEACKEYDCKPIRGMLSHQLTQFRIDGQKTIIQNPSEAQRKEHEKFEISLYDVYAIDICVSTGSGVAREMDAKVSIFKRTDKIRSLNLRVSRWLYNEIKKEFNCMPFNLRSFEDTKQARAGTYECLKNELLKPFPVLFEKPDEIVVQYKFTVMVLPSGPSKITGLPFDESLFESKHSICDPDLKAMVTSLPREVWIQTVLLLPATHRRNIRLACHLLREIASSVEVKKTETMVIHGNANTNAAMKFFRRCDKKKFVNMQFDVTYLSKEFMISYSRMELINILSLVFNDCYFDAGSLRRIIVQCKNLVVFSFILSVL